MCKSQHIFLRIPPPNTNTTHISVTIIDIKKVYTH